MSLDNLWKEALNRLETRSNRAAFELFIKRIAPVALSEGVLYVCVPNSLSLEYLEEVKALIEETTSEALGEKIRLEASQAPKESAAGPTQAFHKGHREKEATKKPAAHAEAKQDAQRRPNPAAAAAPFVSPEPSTTHRRNEAKGLNPKYLFESFVVGNTNRMCYAASKAVAEAPGKAYNPLFLYGGVGLGKTHLMHAVGHYVEETKPNLKIIYVTTDAMYHEMTQMIQENRLRDFQKKYQKADLLLVDDIQFLQGKERTQLEFFHVFNALYDNGKQIVITCDRLPKEIPKLEDRLVSRLNWGLITDIKPPDFETRVAILNEKMKERGGEVPSDILEHVASLVTSNIRDLEGALTKICAFSELSGKKIDVKLVDEVISDLITPDKEAKITILKIQECVANYFGVDLNVLRSKRRTKDVVAARMVCMHLCRDLTSHSLAEIGKAFGNKDHTSVLYCCEKVENRLRNNDDELKKQIRDLKETLGVNNLLK